jgi:cell division septation protein DedD
MRSTELLEEEETAAGGELNLGLGSIIAIFFGLALVCGVFFGFGYMMGHRAPAPSLSSETPDEAPKRPAAAPKPSAQIASQPSDANRVVVPSSAAEADQQSGASESPAPPGEPTRTASLTPAPIPEAAARTVAAASSKPAPATVSAVAPATVASPAGGSIMVQIAAVKNRPDAEALAAALQKNGFNATIRTEPQDKLLHVQVGPFDNRDDARAMLQKLSNAGYNAFIK